MKLFNRDGHPLMPLSEEDSIRTDKKGYRFQFVNTVVTIVTFLVVFTSSSYSDSYSEAVLTQLATTDTFTVGLKSDGTVIGVGDNRYGQLNVSSWTGITQLAVGSTYTVGLKSDGTVVAVGNVGHSDYGQLNVSSWTGITQLAAASIHTVGLKSDGTVVAVGYNGYGQLNVSSWTGITQLAAESLHTVGLKSDGTVIGVGDNRYGQLNVSSWTGITQLAVGSTYTVGLKSDGTVVAVGDNYSGQLNVGSWAGITQLAAGKDHTVGLKSDGTVIGVGDNSYGQLNVSSWRGITQLVAGPWHTVGLKSDGTAVGVGWNIGQIDFGYWIPCKIGFFRPSIGWWYFDHNGNGVEDDGYWPAEGLSIQGDIPVTGDWNGDGTTKTGVFRPSIGWWFLDYNGNRAWDGCVIDRCYNFGISEDTPVTGDWDGDGKTEIGVYRKSIGWWFLDYNADGTWSGCSADRCYNFGIDIDTPVTGDWNGDGKTEIGVFRASIHMWFLDVNADGTWSGCGPDGCYRFGISVDLPVTGDWNGDGYTEIGVFRPSTGRWYLDSNGNDTWNDCWTDRCYQLGTSVDVPVSGAF